MKCQDVREIINRLEQGGIEPDNLADLPSHLSKCDECQRHAYFAGFHRKIYQQSDQNVDGCDNVHTTNPFKHRRLLKRITVAAVLATVTLGIMYFYVEQNNSSRANNDVIQDNAAVKDVSKQEYTVKQVDDSEEKSEIEPSVASIVDVSEDETPVQKHKNNISTKIDDNRRGNSIGNIVNEGWVASRGDFTYFSIGRDHHILYKMNHRNKKLYQIINENFDINDITYINVIGDWIYFTAWRKSEMEGKTGLCKTSIYKIKSDGTNFTKVLDGYCRNLNVIGDRMYFCQSTDAEQRFWGIYAMNVNGTGLTLIRENVQEPLFISDNKLYFFEADEEQAMYLCTANLDGTNTLRIQKSEHCSLAANEKGLLYFINMDEELCSLNIKENRVLKVLNKGASCLNYSGGWLYYTKYEDGKGLYRLRIRDGKKERLCENEVSNVCIAGEYVFFTLLDDYLPYIMKKDGSQLKEVKDFIK